MSCFARWLMREVAPHYPAVAKSCSNIPWGQWESQSEVKSVNSWSFLSPLFIHSMNEMQRPSLFFSNPANIKLYVLCIRSHCVLSQFITYNTYFCGGIRFNRQRNRKLVYCPIAGSQIPIDILPIQLQCICSTPNHTTWESLSCPPLLSNYKYSGEPTTRRITGSKHACALKDLYSAHLGRALLCPSISRSRDERSCWWDSHGEGREPGEQENHEHAPSGHSTGHSTARPESGKEELPSRRPCRVTSERRMRRLGRLPVTYDILRDHYSGTVCVFGMLVPASWHFTVVPVCISWVINYVGHICVCYLKSADFLWRTLLKRLPIVHILGLYLSLSFENSLYGVDTNLLDVWSENVFSSM